MSGASFSALAAGVQAANTAALLRNAAVASLLAYGTLAGAAVEAERIDPVPSGEMPRILVFCDQNGEVASRGGTAPAFDERATLVVQCLAERAQAADLIADIDTLIAQVKDCLFGDPAWTVLSQRIESFRARTSLAAGRGGERLVGDARIEIVCSWKGIYPPRIATVLDGIDITIGAPSVPATPAAPASVPVNTTVDL